MVFTDFMLFIVAMIGSIAAAYFALGHAEIGSLKALLEHPNLEGKTGFLPTVETNLDGGLTDANLDLWMTLMVMPLVIQWWSVWYPGRSQGRRLYRSTYAGSGERAARDRSDIVLQFCPLRFTALALDHCRPGIAGGVPNAREYTRGFPGSGPQRDRP